MSRLTARVGLLAALLWLAALDAAGQTLLLVDTPAGQAFKARRYDVALAELQKMAEADPKDVLVLRYLGMTLDRLGRYRDAIQTFQQALALEPRGAALHFHLATTYYKAGAPDLAAQSFRRVIELEPSSLYGDTARRYLEALGQQRSQLQQPVTPAPVTAYVALGVQYDSNVPAAPRNRTLFEGDRAGVRVFEYLSGEYRVLRVPGWLAWLEGSTYQAQYPDRAFDRFDLSTYRIGGSLQRDTTLGGLSVTGSMKYTFDWVLLDGDRYSRSHVATVGGRLDLTPRTTTALYYRYSQDDFADEGFDRAISSRDADNHAVGLGLTWYFSERKGQVRAGYEFQENRADGLNFDFEAHKVTVDGVVPLLLDIQGTIGAEYTHESYHRFQGPVRRRTNRRAVTASLSRWLGQRFVIKLDCAFTDEGSSYEALTYQRWVVGGSLGYAY